MSERTQIQQHAIGRVKFKARGRTRYEGQNPYIDETLVDYIEQLERHIEEHQSRDGLQQMRIEQLEREREALTPPAHGGHGGPLVRITATYEDGSTHEIPREVAERARDEQ